MSGGPRLVVAGAILDGSRLLAARRSAPPELAGQWELPGGKVEPGEEPREALARELREELGVVVRLGEVVPAPDGGDWPVLGGHVMRVWLCAIGGGEALPLQDHDQLAWVELEDAGSVRWLAPDLPIVRAIRDQISA
ncbi:MAG: (deoxy)nucleoside triphosphate pyrophosphohydrolase [Actinomycetota bacterium]